MKADQTEVERGPGAIRGLAWTLASLALTAAAWLAAAPTPGAAQSRPCPDGADDCGSKVATVPPGQYPRISFRAIPGVIGSQGQDSTVSRKITLVWDRNLALEQQLRADTAGGGFGGYNVYRVFTDRDTCRLELLRRFVFKDTLLWHFGDNQTTISFVDPDSAGNLVKICRPNPVTGAECPRPGDSVFVFQRPPPPPDGFPTYYAIVYAADPRLVGGGFENKFAPDTLDNWARCGTVGDRTTCCNLNHLALNLMTEPVFITGPPRQDLERVFVVPNPYNGRERWDPSGQNRIEFRGLPEKAEIRIYTVAGDLVRVLERNDPISGAETWDLKNADGREVTGGIYIYKVTTPEGFRFTSHFVVIR